MLSATLWDFLIFVDFASRRVSTLVLCASLCATPTTAPDEPRFFSTLVNEVEEAGWPVTDCVAKAPGLGETEGVHCVQGSITI